MPATATTAAPERRASPTVAEAHALLAERGTGAWVELVRRYGRTFDYMGAVVTSEPEAVRALLMERTHTERRSRSQDMIRHLPGANGILFLDGEAWLRRLKALTPSFAKARLDRFPAQMHGAARAHLARWRFAGAGADLFPAVTEMSVEIALRVGYGLDPETPLARELGRLLIAYKRQTMGADPRQRLDEFGFAPGKLLHAPWLLHGIWRLRGLVEELRALVPRLLAQAQPEADDWISLLARSGLSHEEIADELNHLYGAYTAFDYTLTCTLFELARHGPWLTALREEWRTALEGRPHPTREDLPRLPKTMQVLQEVFRLYPVSMSIARRTGEPMVLGGRKRPAGTEVIILPQALHCDPEFWDRPEEFRPERWEGGAAPKVPYSYIPFLQGPRKCIGRQLAELELVVVLHALLERHDLLVGRPDLPVSHYLLPRFVALIPFAVRDA